MGPTGHRIGLDHEGVLSSLRAFGYRSGKRRSLRRIYGDVLAMERAALAVVADQIERQRMKAGR